MSEARGHVETSGGNGQEMLEELLGPFPVVRLRGLPFEAQVRDVILFFQVSSGVAHVEERCGREFASVHMARFLTSAHPYITPPQGIGVLDVVMMNKGECMVLFNTVMDTQLALGRDR